MKQSDYVKDTTSAIAVLHLQESVVLREWIAPVAAIGIRILKNAQRHLSEQLSDYLTTSAGGSW